MVGLKYGSWNGYDYVYGTPESGSMDEVIRAFPYQLELGQQLAIIQNSEVGCIYIPIEDPGQPFPIEVLDHVLAEIHSASTGVYEFDNIRDFMRYATSSSRNKEVKLYTDKSKGRYYARYEGDGVCNIADFANPMDTLNILDFDKNLNIVEVKFKEEAKIEEENCDGVDTDNFACTG